MSATLPPQPPLSRSVIHAAMGLSLALLCGACQQTAVATPPPQPHVTLTVAEALHASPASGAATVTGRFGGWNGPCKGAPPRTRSDWMLVGGTADCIYVSGPVPSGITAPPDTQSNGAALTVRGQLMRAEDGRIYLRIQTP